MKKRVLIIIAIITAITIAAVFYAQKKGEHQMQKFSVTASFYPTANFAENIVGNTANVRVVVLPGVEPHDYEPAPSDLIMVERSKLFIYNGGGFDPWAEKLANTATMNDVSMLNISERLKGAEGMREGDPHYWLDPIFAIKEVEIIRDELIKENPARALIYQENARAYIEKLLALHRDYESGLRSCALRDIVVSHTAFAYLAARYAINAIPIAGISPTDEPSTKKIGQIADTAREKGIRFIFFETTASPKLAETIAREIGIETLVLNPIETLTEMELKTGEDYISVMKKNLNNLRKALSCI